jgi:hypothetical protein
MADSPAGRQLIEEISQSPDPVEDAQPAQDLTSRPDEVIQDNLRKRFFMGTKNIKQGQPTAVVKSADVTRPINVPTRLLVDAEGFMGWTGRPPGVKKTISTNEGYQTLNSFDVIKKYAAMDTSPPPLKEMDMFVQPDGKIFFSSGGDGAHRTGAAVLKGESNIDTYSIRVWPMSENLL